MRVGVPGNADAVGHIVQHLADLAQYFAGIGLQPRAAAGEHRPVVFIHDLDAQPLGGKVEQYLLAERVQRRVAFDRARDALLQIAQPELLLARKLGLGRIEVDGLLLLADLATLDLALDAGGVVAAALDQAGPVAAAAAAQQRHFERGLEIFGDALQVVNGGRTEQPHEQKKRHHGGDEIGIGYLPRAAVVAAGVFFYALYDYRPLGIFAHGVCAGGGRALRCFTVSSSSMNVGRSVEYRTLRPNSTATCGA